MSKVIVDEKMVEELLTRGVETVYPNKEDLKKKLMSGDRIRLYCGFDPSADSLHIGNAIAINKLSQFQKLGHEVIFLIGDFTGMIGDPTDKSATRKKLTRDAVLKNCTSYQEQASAYLDFEGDNSATVKYNSEWNDKLSFRDLIELSSNFTVQQMLQRDMFQKRLEEGKPIHLHEFMYPLTQGYDSMAMDVDLELGGNDQMFNMMCGRDLMKATGGKNKFVMTLKLLADDSGKKMGKSEGNAVFLNQEGKDIYGKVMSWEDGVIGRAFELCTKIKMVEVENIYEQLKEDNVNPRDLKMKLAYEMVKLVHGEEEAIKAQDAFVQTFQKKALPDDIAIKTIGVDKMNIVDLLLQLEMVVSKGEARRLMVQNGIKLDGQAINDINFEIVLNNKEQVLQRGKRQFVKVVK